MINSPAVFQACFCLEANLAIKLIVKYFLPENKNEVSPRLGKTIPKGSEKLMSGTVTKHVKTGK